MVCIILITYEHTDYVSSHILFTFFFFFHIPINVAFGPSLSPPGQKQMQQFDWLFLALISQSTSCRVLILRNWIGSLHCLFFFSSPPCCHVPPPISKAIVRGDIVESKQEAEWTIIPPEAAPPQEQCSSEQEVLER